jgi:hypothetical protein
VEALEACPDVVLCQSQVKVVDELGDCILDFHYPPGHASSPVASQRFGDVLRQDRWDFEVFGLIRSSALMHTRLLDRYIASDRVLRAELVLRGRYHIVPAPLFFSRDHSQRSVRAYPAHHLRGSWFDPALAGRTVFPHWRVLGEYVRAIHQARLPAWQRVCCQGQLARWLFRDLNWARLAADLVIAVFPGSWQWLASMARSSENWLRRTA